MRMIRFILYGVTVLVATCVSVHAQEGVMWVKVLDYNGRPVPQAAVCNSRKEVGDCRADDAGLVRIKLGPGVKANTSVELFMLNKEYLLIEPWDHKVRVPAPPRHDITVRVMKFGDTNALKNRMALASIVKWINAQKLISGQKRTQLIDAREAALSYVAQVSGFTPRQLDRSIRDQMRIASASEKGIYALYVGNLPEAERQLLISRAASRGVRGKFAENDFFLGQAQFELCKYREAQKSFQSALDQGMGEDARVLDYLSKLLLLSGDVKQSLEKLQKSLSLKERSLDDAHPDLLATRSDLAVIYARLDRYGEAEELLNKIWLTCEEAIKKDFSTTANAIFNLIELYAGFEDDLEREDEVNWLADLLQKSAESEVQAGRMDDLMAMSVLIQIYVLRDDNGDDEGKATRKAKAVELVQKVKARIAEESKPGRPNVRAGSRGPRAQSTSRTTASPKFSNAAWAIPTFMVVSEMDLDEDLKKQLFKDAITLAEQIIEKDPPNGILPLIVAAPSYLGEDRAEADRLYKIILSTAENTSVLENPLVEQYFLRVVVRYYVNEVTEEEVDALFRRVGVVSNKVWKNSHVLDAPTLVALFTLLSAGGQDFETADSKKILEAPVEAILANAEGILEAADGDRLESLLKVTGFYVLLGKYEEAITLLQKIQDKVEGKWGSKHILSQKCRLGIVGAYMAQDNKERAATLHSEAIEYEKRMVGPRQKSVGELMKTHAEILEGLGRTDEAESLSEEADKIIAEAERVEKTRWLQKTFKERSELEAKEKSLGKDHPGLIPLLSSLAKSYLKQGNITEAEVFYRRLLAAYEKSPGLDIADLVATSEGLGDALALQEKYTEAEAIYLRALKLCRERPDGNSFPVAMLSQKLAGFYEALSNLPEAEKFYRQSIEILEKLPEEWQKLFLPDVLEKYARLLRSSNREAEAEKLMQRFRAPKKQD